jgi:CheY-like chemotaxis protein
MTTVGVNRETRSCEDSGMKRKTKIILVEYDDLYRSALRNFLSSHDHLEVVAAAGSGEEAVRAIRELSADLVLLDLNLPKLKGNRLLQEIRKISPIKILAHTAFSSFEGVDEAMHAGADGYCFKDVRRTEIIDALARTAAGEPYVCRTTEDYPNDKRKEDRFDCDCSINWNYFKKGIFSTARVLNCSRIGCYIESDNHLAPGSLLLIRATRCREVYGDPKVSGGLEWNSMAEVRWCSKLSNDEGGPYGSGLGYFSA